MLPFEEKLGEGAITLTVEVAGQSREIHRLSPQKPCTIGRAFDNTIAIADAAVSRRHIQIECRDGEWWVEDLGSSNGSLVNGQRLEATRKLNGGERIEVGSTQLLFSTGRRAVAVDLAEADEPVAVRSLDMHTILGSVDDYRTAEQGPLTERPDEFFGKVDRVGLALLSHCALSELLPKIVDLVGEILNPDRAALLFPRDAESASPEEGELIVGALYRAECESREGIQISRSIARQVIEDHKAVLVADAQHDQRFQAQESVVLHQIQSALCVPLWDDQQVTGLLYADRTSPIHPYGVAELHLLTLVGHLAAVKIKETVALEELQRKQKLEEELKNAARIQQQLLPGESLKRADVWIAGYNIPCLGVGGDYYDYIEEDDGSILLALGDVSGKGMSAALLMASVHTHVRALAGAGLALDAMAKQIGKQLHRSIQGERFVTLFIARLDPATGRLQFVNAGHNHPLLLRGSGAVETLETGGLMLGAFPGIEYDSGEVTLESGDQLLIFSDGITEAGAEDQEEDFGDDRLLAFFKEHRALAPEEFIALLVEEVKAYAAPGDPGDDVTVLMVRRP